MSDIKRTVRELIGKRSEVNNLLDEIDILSNDLFKKKIIYQGKEAEIHSISVMANLIDLKIKDANGRFIRKEMTLNDFLK